MTKKILCRYSIADLFMSNVFENLNVCKHLVAQKHGLTIMRHYYPFIIFDQEHSSSQPDWKHQMQ